jgi:hypothetical protein
MSDSDADRDRFWALARRYNALGRLLPREDLDAANVAEVRLVLAEMDKTKAEMDMLLARNAPKRSRIGERRDNDRNEAPPLVGGVTVPSGTGKGNVSARGKR